MSGVARTRVGILGATGYGGGELLRILLRHPGVEVVAATSRSQQGTPVGEIHRNLHGATTLQFETLGLDALTERCDLVIGALPHGASAETLVPIVEAGLRVVDLSGDFRLTSSASYKRWYRREHPHPEWLGRAVYGCPEHARSAIGAASLVASPGCFATAINLALLPAAASIAGRASVVAMTGSSGSGADAGPGTHHPTRATTLRPYKVLAHQHTPECLELAHAAGADGLLGIDLTPVSAPLVRGILAVVHVPLRPGTDAEALAASYATRYADAPFVTVLDHREPECASVALTNRAEVRARATEDGALHVMCAIDNLVKGGAGQGVQSMNLMLGLEESLGLDHLGSWP